MKSTIHRLVVVVALIVLGVVFFPRVSNRDKVVVACDNENFPPREVVKTAPESVQAEPAKQTAVDETQAVISADESASISAQIIAARRWFAQSPQEGKGDALVATVEGPHGFSFVAGAADVAVVPRKGVDWSWKMAPMNGRAVVPQAEKEKVRYLREQGVEEWFVNIDGGIEHGFTLTEDQGETVRRVSCRVMTELSPVMRPGRDGVDFLNDAGEAQLHYDGLYAYDATGRMLPAWMETEAGKGSHELTLAVDTTEAKFPVTIDPIISLAAAEVRSAVVQADDGFATSMDTQGNWLVVGAPGRDGIENPTAGAVFVFERELGCPPHWTQRSMVMVPGLFPQAVVVRSFGRKVAFGGNTLAVTAEREGNIQGTIHEVRLFSLDASGMATAVKTLEVGLTNVGFAPSIDVSADGNWLVVGTAGITASSPGLVLVYGRNVGGPNNWGEAQVLAPAGASAGAEYGREVSLSENLLAVSAPGLSGGRVFVYAWDGLTWQEDEILSPPSAPAGQTVQGFGKSISLHNNWLAIGAPDSDGQRSNTGRVILAQRRAVTDSTFQTTSYVWFTDHLLPAGDPGTASFSLEPDREAGFGTMVSMEDGRLAVGEAVANGQRVTIYQQRSGTTLDLSSLWSVEKQLSPAALGLEKISSMRLREGGLLLGDSVTGKIVEQRRTLTNWPATQHLSEGPAEAAMGWRVARDGDLLAVSAPGANAVHVFRRNHSAPASSQWTLAWTTQDVAGYGASIALKDDILLVGSPEFSTGSVLVFRRTNAAATTWSSPQILLPPANFPAESFGSSIAFNGAFAVVGDPLVQSGRGGTVIFQRPESGLWPVVSAGFASAPYLGYGAAVAITESNDIIVGAPHTPVPADIPVADGGAVFVWKYQPEQISGSIAWAPAWALDQHLFPTGSVSQQSGGLFGASVALFGQHAFVGAPGDGTVTKPGVVYVFRRDQPAPAAAIPRPTEVPWRLLEKLSPTGPGAEDAVLFGSSLAATNGDMLAVGAPGNLLKRGQVFVFEAAGLLRFSPSFRLLNPCGGPGDGFGQSVALSVEEAVVGSPSHGVFVFERQRSEWRLAREVPTEINSVDGQLAVGSDIAIDGDWMVVGAPKFITTPLPPPQQSGPPTSIDPNYVPEEGRTFFVLHRHANPVADQYVWQITSTIGMPGAIRAFPSSHNDRQFRHGGSVAISGRHVVIGSPAYGYFSGEDTPPGRAYVFELNAEGKLATLYPSSEGFKYAYEALDRPGYALRFGHDVAISGDWIAVASGDMLVNGGTQTGIGGMVSLYRKRGWHERSTPISPTETMTEIVQWQREKTIIGEDFGYGCAVALDGGRLAVGAFGSYGMMGGSVGGVYLYEQHQGGTDQWGATKFITDPLNPGNPDEMGHLFGADVALEGDTLVVGYAGRYEWQELPTWATGGRALVLERHVGGHNQWGPVAMLTGDSEGLGVKVAISGGLIALGVPGGTLIDENEEEFDVPGSVALFRRSAPNNGFFPEIPPDAIPIGGSFPDFSAFTGWGKVATIRPPNTNRLHTWNFGAAVALDGHTLAVGAPGEVEWHTEDSNDADFLADSVEIDRITPGRAFVYELKGNAAQTALDQQFPDLLTQAAGGVPYSGVGPTGDLDFDHDGLSNTMETFHGLNPFVSDAAAVSSLIDAATGELIMRWREGIDTGFVGTPQWSRDVTQWHDDGSGPAVGDVKTLSVSTVSSHPDHVIKEARVSMAGENRLFLRLQVTGE